MYQGYEQHQPLQISERISIEPLLAKHANALLEVVNESRDNLSRYLPWTDFVTNRREAVRYISQRINSNALEAYWFALLFDNQFVGVFGIKGVNGETGVAEIGYWIGDIGRGHGLVNQVLSKIIPLVKQRGHTNLIQFHCMEDNIASIKVAQRAGATLKEYVDHSFETLDSSQRLGIYELKLTTISN
ncbi:GNAT family N-acetyltransferase [Vibrio rotiferianus]|jgi:ribosomal-protein-serine acetyltransferase|uniref:GNAT family N-acetyltransferase n=1 Tax=Vibrio rotiferianus TaxID=190895 RepID=UPI00406AA8B9